MKGMLSSLLNYFTTEFHRNALELNKRLTKTLESIRTEQFDEQASKYVEAVNCFGEFWVKLITTMGEVLSEYLK